MIPQRPPAVQNGWWSFHFQYRVARTARVWENGTTTTQGIGMLLRLLNPVLGIVWLMVGAAMLVTDWRRGIPTFYFPIAGRPISLGWLALALAGYNFARWWSVHRWLASRRALDEAESRRRHQRPAHFQQRPLQEPDPNFIFTDQPPDREP